MTRVSTFAFNCPFPLRSPAQARMTARPVGRGRGAGAGACPWFEVGEGESEEGARLVRPGAAYPEPPGIGRDSWEGTLRQETGREDL